MGATDFSCHDHVANAIIVGVNTFLFLAVLARFSNIDFFLKILALKDDELVKSEMYKKWGVTDFVLERTCPEEHLNLSKLGFVGEEGHSSFLNNVEIIVNKVCF